MSHYCDRFAPPSPGTVRTPLGVYDSVTARSDKTHFLWIILRWQSLHTTSVFQSHSRFFIPPFVRHSWLGHPRLAMRLGKFGFSVSLSLRYHRFPYRLYGMIDNRQTHNHSLPFPYQRFQAIFLHLHITETGSLRSVNPTYTLYPINIAVQSHPIAFR